MKHQLPPLRFIISAVLSAMLCSCDALSCQLPFQRMHCRPAGIFSRAVKATGNKSLITGMAEEATELRKVLAQKLAEVRLC